MTTVSRVSRKTTKKTGTAKTSTVMVTLINQGLVADYDKMVIWLRKGRVIMVINMRMADSFGRYEQEKALVVTTGESSNIGGGVV